MSGEIWRQMSEQEKAYYKALADQRNQEKMAEQTVLGAVHAWLITELMLILIL